MKHGGEYAKQVKKLFQQLTRKFGKPAPGEPGDPIEQLMIGILAECTTFNKAQSAFRRVRGQMVDLNDLRVTPPFELARLIGDGIPLAAVKARRMIETLNAVRVRQETMDLSFLRQRGRREAREYLESLEGAGPYASAYVVLYSLGGHAIPVDAQTLYVLRKEGIVEPSATLDEVQGFLERHVNASNAQVFCDLLNRYVNAKAGRVSAEDLPALLAPPASDRPEPAEPAPPAAPEPAAKTAKPAPKPEEGPPAKAAARPLASTSVEGAGPAAAPGKKSAARAAKTAASKTATPEKPKPRKKK